MTQKNRVHRPRTIGEARLWLQEICEGEGLSTERNLSDELYLQFGYGMMEHCRVLLDSWGAAVSSSAPAISRTISSYAWFSHKRNPGGDIMLDPQFYLPHSDHEKLCNHAYWQPTMRLPCFGRTGTVAPPRQLARPSMPYGSRASYFPVCSRHN